MGDTRMFYEKKVNIGGKWWNMGENAEKVMINYQLLGSGWFLFERRTHFESCEFKNYFSGIHMCGCSIQRGHENGQQELGLAPSLHPLVTFSDSGMD